MSKGSDTDYWFLRENGIPAKIALRILAIAYKTEKREEEVKRQTEEEWLEERKRIREIQDRHTKKKGGEKGG